MQGKRLVLRAEADREIDAARDHYMAEGGFDIADGFIEALEAAFRHVSLHPGTGSPRYGHKLSVPGLRSWGLPRFPYIVFYIDMPDHIDVVRVLHSAMDITEVLPLQFGSKGLLMEPAAAYAVESRAEWDLQ